MKAPSRTRSVGTKVSEEEYLRLEVCASHKQLSVGQSCPETLLAAADIAPGSHCEKGVVDEVIALGTVVASLIYAFTSEGKVTAEQMRAFIERADGTRAKRAAKILSQVGRTGKANARKETQSAEEAD